MWDMSGLTERNGTIALPDRFDIGAAPRLRQALLSASGDVSLDASRVTIVTTPALQVLMAARDHLSGQGRALSIDAPSPCFLACIETLGVPMKRIVTAGCTA